MLRHISETSFPHSLCTGGSFISFCKSIIINLKNLNKLKNVEISRFNPTIFLTWTGSALLRQPGSLQLLGT
jgi:hypothetical protein